jgi:hypothetical protein
VALKELDLSLEVLPLPEEVAALLERADAVHEEFLRVNSDWGTGFYPSDYVTVYHALRTIRILDLMGGDSFCEWGSGLGVVTMLAEMQGLQACGIEINRDLVDAAIDLAEAFDSQAEFVHGSFVPRGCEARAEKAYAATDEGVAWLTTETDNAYDDLGLDPDDFDLVFAYPWPGEESVIDELFEHCAADGALLLTYGQQNSVRLQRKTSSRMRSN